VRELATPSGQLPPATVRLASGEEIALPPFAAGASDRHLAAHPEDVERYGEHARAWCVHDLQWLALWAVQDADDQGVDLAAQLDWLARVLEARDYPLESLADAVGSLADELRGTLPGAADLLDAGAAQVRP
jgi:hypothetical protein